MSPIEDRDAQVDYLLRLGDNGLVLAQQLAAWCGHGPALEEDLALTNTALDLLGQARQWLSLAGELEGRGRDEDALAYGRDVPAFRNLLLVEQPNGHYGDTLMRQFLFDAWHLPLLEALAGCADTRVAGIARKAAKEVRFHRARSADLVIALGDGTPESHARMQQALDRLWPYTGEFFAGDAVDAACVEAGLAPAAAQLEPAWQADVAAVFGQATLRMPARAGHQRGGRQGLHSEHLGHLLADLQFMQRAYPGMRW